MSGLETRAKKMMRGIDVKAVLLRTHFRNLLWRHWVLRLALAIRVRELINAVLAEKRLQQSNGGRARRAIDVSGIRNQSRLFFKKGQKAQVLRTCF